MLGPALLKRALDRALQCDNSDALSPQSKHRARSSAWVTCLAGELQSLYGPTARAFSKSDPAHRDDFGLNELLYDVCVCETAECPSYRGTKQLKYVTRALWQVESEFARDSAEAIKDFNKLVIGRAENKLFIGPRLGTPDAEQGYLDALLPVAKCAANDRSTAVYVALVPHPADWETDPAGAKLWRLRDAAWEPVTSDEPVADRR